MGWLRITPLWPDNVFDRSELHSFPDRYCCRQHSSCARALNVGRPNAVTVRRRNTRKDYDIKSQTWTQKICSRSALLTRPSWNGDGKLLQHVIAEIQCFVYRVTGSGDVSGWYCSRIVIAQPCGARPVGFTTIDVRADFHMWSITRLNVGTVDHSSPWVNVPTCS